MKATGGPPADTVPAMRKVWVCPLSNQRMGVLMACSAFSLSACRAAVLRNTASGAKKSRRLPPSNKRGMSAGAIGASLMASLPTTRSTVPSVAPSVLPCVPCLLGVFALPGSFTSPVWLFRPGSSTVVSIHGTAAATPAVCATCGYSASGRPPCMACSCKSGWPLTLRTARENSSSADWLMTCTAKPSATPSMMATSAVAVRQGCWRSSCQEKLVSSSNKGVRVITKFGVESLASAVWCKDQESDTAKIARFGARGVVLTQQLNGKHGGLQRRLSMYCPRNSECTGE